MIKVDKISPIPIYKQIILQVKKEIILGRLKKGDRLPSIRDLAKFLNVNVNTVLKAYDRLSMEGVISSEQGKGFFVSSEMSIPEGVLKGLKESIENLKRSGVELGLAMMIVQEVWNDEKI